jgi:hypothetical protein
MVPRQSSIAIGRGLVLGFFRASSKFLHFHDVLSYLDVFFLKRIKQICRIRASALQQAAGDDKL